MWQCYIAISIITTKDIGQLRTMGLDDCQGASRDGSSIQRRRISHSCVNVHEKTKSYKEESVKENGTEGIMETNYSAAVVPARGSRRNLKVDSTSLAQYQDPYLS